jgi:predicted nuclease with TOPRIM domain
LESIIKEQVRNLSDIERVKKVEALAKELMRHGLANDIQDALAQAERSIQIKGDIKTTIQQPQQQAQQQVQAPQPTELDELKKQLKQHGEIILQLQSKMNEMIGEINKFDKKISEIETKLSSIDTSNVHQTVQPQQVVQPAAQPAQPTQQGIIPSNGSKRGEGAAPEIRTGNYKPGDFNISNIFYSGPRGAKK